MSDWPDCQYSVPVLVWITFGQFPRVVQRVRMPSLAPVVILVSVLTMAGYFQLFAEPYVMTQGGPANATETINLLLFNQAFSYFNMGYAASMAVALFAIVLGSSLILIKVRRSTAW